MIISLSSNIENEFIRSYFGSWIDQINLIMDDGKKVNRDEKKENWQKELSLKYPGWSWAGSGSYRWVLSPDDSHVVKFAQSGYMNSSGIKLNKMESERQLEFEGLFPRVFFHHPNWEWIVVENVKPAGINDLIEYFSISKNGAFGFSKLLSYHISVASGNADRAERLKREFFGSKLEFKEDYEKLKSNIDFRRMANIAEKLNLWDFDLGAGNLGINRDGKLVILDSSFPV